MKRIVIYVLTVVMLMVTSCYKDYGNYDYVIPEEPVVLGLSDTVFIAFVGDTLHIKPDVTMLSGAENLSYEWEIIIPEEQREILIPGLELKLPFTLLPKIYNGKFMVTDTSNGMKYFHDFQIEGRTEFSQGLVVLSIESGITRLSFVKPDKTVKPRLYELIHGETLPSGPLQLLANNEPYLPTTINTYLFTFSDPENPGIEIDANVFHQTKVLKDYFFTPPSVISPNNLIVMMNGTMIGAINHKMYIGTSSTASWSPYYGLFGDEAEGDYEISGQFIFEDNLGVAAFDINRQQFVRFSHSAVYFGTDYNVIGSAFDPLNVGMDLLFVKKISSDSYAFCKDESGTIYELNFVNDFSMATNTFYPNLKREFAGSSLVTENTKWQGAATGVFFFTSNDKIYRYNPLNQDLKVLDADFGGKQVSMILLTENENILIAGIEGQLYFLDISVGQIGNIIDGRTITGIPGEPVLLYEKL